MVPCFANLSKKSLVDGTNTYQTGVRNPLQERLWGQQKLTHVTASYKQTHRAMFREKRPNTTSQVCISHIRGTDNDWLTVAALNAGTYVSSFSSHNAASTSRMSCISTASSSDDMILRRGVITRALRGRTQRMSTWHRANDSTQRVQKVEVN
jgi:hypothetical protein